MIWCFHWGKAGSQLPDFGGKHLHSYKHQQGRCVMHLGKRRHGALPISSGRRMSLIMWCHWAARFCFLDGWDMMGYLTYGYGSISINTIFSGMNIHKSQLFWCELQGYKVLTHCHMAWDMWVKIFWPRKPVAFLWQSSFIWSDCCWSCTMTWGKSPLFRQSDEYLLRRFAAWQRHECAKVHKWSECEKLYYPIESKQNDLPFSYEAIMKLHEVYKLIQHIYVYIYIHIYIHIYIYIYIHTYVYTYIYRL